MKKLTIFLAALIFLAPGLVFSDAISFKAGLFIPRAQSDLWEIEFENMSFQKSDFQNTTFSFSYEYFVSRELSLVLGIDGYNRKKVGHYVDYVGEEIGNDLYAFDYGEGFAVKHVFDVSSTPIQASIKLTPLGKRTKFIPYVGGGVGLYFWAVRLQGDVILFDEYDIFYDPNIDKDVYGYLIQPANLREENKVTIGYHAFGGFMIPVARRIAIEAEFKYNMVKGNFKDSFQGFEPFDLSGYQISIGINYWF